MDNKILYWDNQKHLNQIKYIVQDKSLPSVLVGTSDTVFGLFAALSQNNFEKINKIKERNNKPYLVLIGSIEKIQNFTDSNNLAHIQKLLQHCWPGPLTVIVKAGPDVPGYIKGPDNTIALRVPDHKGLLAVLQDIDGLFSTSANLTGEPIPKELADINQTILDQCDYIVLDSEQSEQKEEQPSTILDCTGLTIKVIREGAYPIDQLEKIYGSRFS